MRRMRTHKSLRDQAILSECVGFGFNDGRRIHVAPCFCRRVGILMGPPDFDRAGAVAVWLVGCCVSVVVTLLCVTAFMLGRYFAR